MINMPGPARIGKQFTVKFKPYKGTDIVESAKRAVFKAANKAVNRWRDNIDHGTGADGSHGRPYVDTGEAKSDITISPQAAGELEYAVGGDVVQLFVAEFGRVPSPNNPPPYQAIARWVERKRIASEGDKDFNRIVHAIQMKIAREGLEGFAPGRGAFNDTKEEIEREASRDLRDSVDRGSKRE